MADIKAYYKNSSYSKQRTYDGSNAVLSYQKKVIKSQLACSDKVILDIGCGCAPISSLVAKRNKVIGMDISESALRIATQNGVCGVLANIEEKFPFNDKEFDFVLLTEVIEHVFDPLALIGEIHRIIKDRGVLICSAPNASFILNRLVFLFTGLFDDCTAKERLIGGSDYISEHIRAMSPKLLKRLLIDSGFLMEKTDYWFPDRFISKQFSGLSFIAKLIKGLRLHQIFPNLISLSFCMVVVKDA